MAGSNEKFKAPPQFDAKSVRFLKEDRAGRPIPELLQEVALEKWLAAKGVGDVDARQIREDLVSAYRDPSAATPDKYIISRALLETKLGSIQATLHQENRTSLDALVSSAATSIERETRRADRQKTDEWMKKGVDAPAQRRLGNMIIESLRERDPVTRFESNRPAFVPGLVADADFNTIKGELEAFIETDPVSGLSEREKATLELLQEEEHSSQSTGTPIPSPGKPPTPRPPKKFDIPGSKKSPGVFDGLDEFIGSEAAGEVTDLVRSIVARLDEEVVESAFVALLGKYGIEKRTAQDAAAVFLNVVKRGRTSATLDATLASLSEKTHAHLGSVVIELGRHIERATRAADEEFVKHPEEPSKASGKVAGVTRFITGSHVWADRSKKLADHLHQKKLGGALDVDAQRALKHELDAAVQTVTSGGALRSAVDIGRDLNVRYGSIKVLPSRWETIAEKLLEYVQHERIARIEEKLLEQVGAQGSSHVESKPVTREADPYGFSKMSLAEKLALAKKLKDRQKDGGDA